MTLYNQSDWARVCGVTRAAVGAAIRAGRLEIAGGRIDSEHPWSQAYLERQKNSVKTHRPGRKGKGGGAPVQGGNAPPLPPGIHDTGVVDADNIHEQGKKYDVRIKRWKERQIANKTLRDEGQLIPLPMVARAFSILNAALEESFRSFPLRSGDLLFDLAAAGSKIEFLERLQTEIDNSMYGVKASTQRAIEKMEIDAKAQPDV